MVRVLDQAAAFSQKGIVHTPSVNTDTCQFDFLQSREGLAYFEPQSGHVPVERSSILNRLIGETMNLLGRQDS
jgi:hypothetical protein